MNLLGREKFKLGNILYVLQVVRNLMSVSRFVSKGDTVASTKDKMTTKKNGTRINLNARKGNHGITMLYLK